MADKRGHHPNSLAALKKYKKDITAETAREFGRLGGVASAAQNKKKRELKEILEQMLNTKPTEEQMEVLKKRYPEINIDNLSKHYAIIASLISKAMAGDISAFLALRDTLGQKPVDKIETTNINAEVDFNKIKELRAKLNGK